LSSASYDHFRGECCTATGRGVSHDQLIDLARKPFAARSPIGASQPMSKKRSIESEGLPEGVLLECEDILEFYLALVADLKARGY